MGSFAYTCCVSGLPIHAGDSVRYFLLTMSPYSKPAEHTCTITDRWNLRTLPLRAKYNDYGSVDRVEEGLARDIWLEGLQVDLITRGTGDNSVHDVGVRKDMSFEDLLGALSEGRVLVRDQGGRLIPSPTIQILEGLGDKLPEELKAELQRIVERSTPPKPKVPKGIPTLKRVKKAIVAAGQTVADSGYQGGFVVDRKSSGFIRVRSGTGCAEGRAQLKALRGHLRKRWATFLTVGTGAYADVVELTLGPKPREGRTYTMVLKQKEKRKALPVAQAMIREDVWQAICGCTFHTWTGRNHKVQAYRDAARDLYQRYHSKGPGILTDPDYTDHPVFHLAHHELTGPGIGYHFHQMMGHDPQGEELERFLDVVGETVFVQGFLASVRHQWRPGHSSGPQFGEWPSQRDYLAALLAIATEKAAEEEAGRVTDEEEEDESGD